VVIPLSHRLAFSLLAALVFSSCSDSSVKPVVTEKFEGILQTDLDCRILGGDMTDFLPRPETYVDTTVSPPIVFPPLNNSLAYTCPNPAEVWSVIHFQLSEPDSVWLFVYDEPGAPPVDTLFSEMGEVGAYMIQWKMPKGPGLYRVRMFTARGFRSYGDVEFTGAPTVQ